ncbi:MAG: hypothetical protein M3Y68_06255, partial [Chloroflexota bacterium]|nr:hypothetical protein [Chloroflexota bacterium]
QVILKALAKDPRDRFETADEFLTAWKRALEEKHTVRWEAPTEVVPMPGTLPPHQTPQRVSPATTTASRPARPAGWIIGCLAGVCLLFAVGGGILLAANRLGPTFLSPPTETPPPTQTLEVIVPTPTVPISSSENVLLEDDFSGESSWGTLTSSDNAVNYDGDAFRIQVFRENWFVWSTPNEDVYQNVHLEVTAINNDGEPTTAFGIMCNQQVSGSSYHYVAITPGGEYAIGKAVTGETDVFLTNNNRWAASDQIPRNAASYRIGADCSPATLTLYVNGQRIASVSDSSYPSGYVGLFAWSGADTTAADVTFDDFLLRSLE